MNKIYWDKETILIMTNQLEAVEHKHWAMQLFFALDEDVNISIDGERISCKCILVNQNVNHSFTTAGHAHVSMIVVPASDFAIELKQKLGESAYFIVQPDDLNKMKACGYQLLQEQTISAYRQFMQSIYDTFGISFTRKQYDDRVQALLNHIDACDCDDHTIATFADKVALSPSRLSHLFREQVGMPLKTYIQLHQMQNAFLALLQGMNITEASNVANFDSPSHFAAVTKRIMGIPASIALKDSVFLKVFND